MDQVLNFFSAMPSWFGVVLLVLFALSGRLFKDNWRTQGAGWKLRCWTYGLISVLSFSLMVFGIFDFSWASG